MRFARIIIGAVALFCLTVAMSSLTVSSAQATPAIAKGQPCGTCHTGSPPSKANVKK
jgi:cytochrome c551/c552